MMDAHGTSVGLDQLIFRARDAPNAAVAGRRELSDPPISTLKRRLSSIARTNRVHITVTIIDNDHLSVRHPWFAPTMDNIARAMNQPTGF